MYSIIIPAKNEPYLTTLIQELEYWFQTIPHEILIQTEPGLSNAVLKGVALAKGENLIIMDADGSHQPSDAACMAIVLEGFDVVVGSKYVEYLSDSEDHFIRKLISKTYSLFARTLLQLTVKDCLSGFIAAKTETVKEAQLNPVGYKWALELLCKTKDKAKVTEYPISFRKRKAGISKAGFGQGIKTFAFILKLWIQK